MRIVSGRWRGRVIKAPADSRVRPTADRVREAWMSIFQNELAGARIIDLFAGSGALGLEALSRGAARALFVDADRDACDLIAANATTLGLVADVTCSPVVRWLAKAPDAGFGWIFLDPPYGSHETGELDKALDLVAKKALLDVGGVLVAEHEWRHPPDDRYGVLALFDQRRYGQTAVSFYRHEGDANAG